MSGNNIPIIEPAIDYTEVIKIRALITGKRLFAKLNVFAGATDQSKANGVVYQSLFDTHG